MKKFFLLVIVLNVIGVFMSCKASDKQQASDKIKASKEQKASNEKKASDEEKEADKPEFFVIDSNSVSGSLKDNVRLINKSSRTGISFTVYLRESSDNKWKVYGTGNLKGNGDTDFISSKLSGTLKNYRYFAIQPQDTRKYRYTFEKTHNDLYIYIHDKK